MTEAKLHKQVMDMLLEGLPSDAVAHHSPNEGKRGWKAQRALKTNGTRAGWPDIEIVWQGRVIFIELKTEKGRISPTQRDTQERLMLAGAVVNTCRSVDEVADFLSVVMGKHWRASVTA